MKTVHIEMRVYLCGAERPGRQEDPANVSRVRPQLPSNLLKFCIRLFVGLFQKHSGEAQLPMAVKIGSKFRKRDAPEYIVEVIELYRPTGTPLHAYTRVTVATHDLGVRLYSVSALEDPRLFVPMGELAGNHQSI